MFSRIVFSQLHNQKNLNKPFAYAWKRTRLDGSASSMLIKNPFVVNATGFTTSSRLDGKHKFVPYCVPPHEDHDYKNMRLKRPMSPHVMMYAPTEPAMTSVAQRGTGALLAFYAFALGFGAIALPNGIESYVYLFQSLDMGLFTILVLKLLMGAPFCFHYFNGIRFCIWNLGKMFSLKELKASAQKVYAAAALLTLFFAII